MEDDLSGASFPAMRSCAVAVSTWVFIELSVCKMILNNFLTFALRRRASLMILSKTVYKLG